MVFLFILMIALCLADFVCDRFIKLFGRTFQPKVRLVRPRQYRFN